MSILVRDFLSVLERLAPPSLAEDWDNTGLQVGSGGAIIDSVLITLNVNAEVISEADLLKCGLILTHHPLIFQPISSVSDESSTGKLIRRANQADISIVAAHTNLDAARGGLADILTDYIGLKNVRPLERAAAKWSKLVTFVPAADLDHVRAALFGAGAGVIGDYQHCSYILEGHGTFQPMEGAKPTIGEVGRDETVSEQRVEMIFPTAQANRIITALVAAHSYEEPAYDIYSLSNMSLGEGSGRVGELESETELCAFAKKLADIFHLHEARYTGPDQKKIGKVAVIPGSGAGYISEAAGMADVLVSGDFKYHDLILAHDLDVALVDIPHEKSELAALERWLPLLNRELDAVNYNIDVKLSSVDTEYWRQGPAPKERVKETGLYRLYVDGGSRGNPGPAGIGAVLQNPTGGVIETYKKYIGQATNNVAEYQAMIAGLDMALAKGVAEIAVFSDSELIVRQLKGAYKVKNEGLRPYYMKAKKLLGGFNRYELTSVARDENEHADELVNEALDESGN